MVSMVSIWIFSGFPTGSQLSQFLRSGKTNKNPKPVITSWTYLKLLSLMAGLLADFSRTKIMIIFS